MGDDLGVDVNAFEDTIGVEGEWEDRANVKRDLEIIHILYGQRIHLLQRLKTHLLT